MSNNNQINHIIVQSEADKLITEVAKDNRYHIAQGVIQCISQRHVVTLTYAQLNDPELIYTALDCVLSAKTK